MSFKSSLVISRKYSSFLLLLIQPGFTGNGFSSEILFLDFKTKKPIFSLLFHLSFFIYYGYVILRKFCYAPTNHEILVAIVLVGICVEQIRRHMSGDTRKGLNRIFEDPFNILYLASFVLASIAGILRFGVKKEKP